MGLSFLAPWFLAGAALVSIPWILHQIRRPEREPISFSSLMFVPEIKKEVIERRRIQHILLMLLRMLILMLLTFAFARPFLMSVVPVEADEGIEWHLIVLDTSYSMSAKNHFEQAKAEALRIVNRLRGQDRVGVIFFTDQPEIAVQLFDEDADTADLARRAIERISVSEKPTAYLPALQAAQEQLLREVEGDTAQRKVLHLITDFQNEGMPVSHAGWKLSPQIQFDPIAVGDEEITNYAITDLNVQKINETEIRILGKIKNTSSRAEEPCHVQLMIGEEVIESQSLLVKRGNSSQVSFRYKFDPNQQIVGWIELQEDDLTVDNRRYFSLNPPRKKEVLIVTDTAENRRYPAAWFIQNAIPDVADVPWSVQLVSSDELMEQMSDAGAKPPVIILCEANRMSQEARLAVVQYAREGGSVLCVLNEEFAENEGAALLWEIGFDSQGPLYEAPRTNRFSLLSWIDFSHPIFMPLNSARYNDFSTLYFYNYIKIKAREDADVDGVKVYARFEADVIESGDPAVIEARLGEGRVMVWTFTPSLEWTNLTKSAKFIPILYETLQYLDGDDDHIRTHIVGDRIRPPYPLNEQAWLMNLPEIGDEKDFVELIDTDVRQYSASGFVRWNQDEQNEILEAVNIDARESDMGRIGVEEFQWKLVSIPVVQEEAEAVDEREAFGQQVTRHLHEYGYPLVLFLFAAVVLEAWYASRLL